MKNSFVKIIGCLIGCMLLFSGATTSQALSLQIQPANQTVFLNNHAVFDVNVSGASGLSAYDITLLFDPLILAAPTVSFGTQLGAPLDSISDVFSGPGSVNIAEVSLLFDLTSQPTSFTLFTLDFLAKGVGTSPIAFDLVTLGDSNGNAILDFSATGGRITVEGGQIPVPEPGTILLISAGLAGLIFWRRKQS